MHFFILSFYLFVASFVGSLFLGLRGGKLEGWLWTIQVWQLFYFYMAHLPGSSEIVVSAVALILLLRLILLSLGIVLLLFEIGIAVVEEGVGFLFLDSGPKDIDYVIVDVVIVLLSWWFRKFNRWGKYLFLCNFILPTRLMSAEC